MTNKLLNSLWFVASNESFLFIQRSSRGGNSNRKCFFFIVVENGLKCLRNFFKLIKKELIWIAIVRQGQKTDDRGDDFMIFPQLKGVLNLETIPSNDETESFFLILRGIKRFKGRFETSRWSYKLNKFIHSMPFDVELVFVFFVLWKKTLMSVILIQSLDTWYELFRESWRTFFCAESRDGRWWIDPFIKKKSLVNDFR